MKYLYLSLALGWIGVAGVMATGGQLAPREARCKHAEKGSIVATLNCPALPETPAEARVEGAFDRKRALAEARGAPPPRN